MIQRGLKRFVLSSIKIGEFLSKIAFSRPRPYLWGFCFSEISPFFSENFDIKIAIADFIFSATATNWQTRAVHGLREITAAYDKARKGVVLLNSLKLNFEKFSNPKSRNNLFKIIWGLQIKWLLLTDQNRQGQKHLQLSYVQGPIPSDPSALLPFWPCKSTATIFLQAEVYLKFTETIFDLIFKNMADPLDIKLFSQFASFCSDYIACPTMQLDKLGTNQRWVYDLGLTLSDDWAWDRAK